MKRLVFSPLVLVPFALVPLLVATPALAKGNAEAGKEKAAACIACHGVNGLSTTPGFPILAGQSRDYLEHTLHAYKSGKRKNPVMAGMAAPLSDTDIADLAEFFSLQKGLHTKY